jgi:HK97 family phage portal protein
MVIGGESFVELVGDSVQRPQELWARRPDKIAVLPDKSRLAYPMAAGYTWADKDDDYQWEADEMIHWKFDNPVSPWRGLSLIGSVRAGLTIDIFAQAWSKKFLKDGGEPTGVLVAPQGIGTSERESLERSFNEKFMGYQNWHRWAVFEKDIIDVKPLSFPPKDMQWLEQRKFAREEIGAILGVPDVLLGFGPETYDTEEKRTAALRTLWTLTLVPLVKMRDDQLNSFFTRQRPMLKPGETIATDLSGVGVLDEDIAPKVETAKSLWAMGVPFNTIDERLGLGIGEIDGGATGYLPLNLLPADGSGDMFTPSAPSAPPELEEPEPPKMLTDGVENKAPEYGSIEHRAFMNRQDELTRPNERAMVRALKKFFQRQQLDIGTALRDKVRTPAGDADVAPLVLPPVSTLLDWDQEEIWWIELMHPIVYSMFLASGQAALDLVLGPQAIPFAVDGFQVKQAIDYILTQHSDKTNNTTFKELTGLFKEAEDEGASIPNIMDKLSTYFKGRKSAYETERIARTTMIASHNAASLQAYADSGIVYGTEWLATLDSRVRDTHRDAHGQFKPLGGRFEVGGALLRFPGDPSGPPGETINCRCTAVPFTRDIDQI